MVKDGPGKETADLMSMSLDDISKKKEFSVGKKSWGSGGGSWGGGGWGGGWRRNRWRWKKRWGGSSTPLQKLQFMCQTHYLMPTISIEEQNEDSLTIAIEIDLSKIDGKDAGTTVIKITKEAKTLEEAKAMAVKELIEHEKVAPLIPKPEDDDNQGGQEWVDWKCSKCGTMNDKDLWNCSNCGKRFRMGEDVPEGKSAEKKDEDK